MEGRGEEEAEEKVEAFIKWAAEIGISDSPSPTNPSQSSPSSTCLGQSLILSHFPDAGGRGLAAARELGRGERVLKVPRDALLTTESVLKDENLAACVRRYPHLSSTQVDDAIWISEKAVLKAQSDWKEAIILMQEIGLRPQFLTFRSWLWASATISSRALHIPWDDAGCLCPVGDFFNYAAPEDELFSEDVEAEASSTQIRSLWKYNNAAKRAEQIDGHSRRLTDGGYEEDVASYCFYARKRYKKGEQVLLGYGTYTNLELLEHYGFLLNVNPNDKAFILLNPDIQTNSWPKHSLYIQHDGRPSFALLSALRLWATPRNLRREVGHLAYSGSQLSADNEMAVMEWMARNCRGMLGEMPTSLADDGSLLGTIDKILKHPSCKECIGLGSSEGELREFFQVNGLHKGEVAGSPFPMKAKRSMERWRLAVQWRLSYKKLLLDCISYCNEVIDVLSLQHGLGGRTNKI